ncbi:MAG: bifunctional adenosylcobinamide kinase/adenosylcobinamide-phosphate guanylyltransferase [Eubacteriaceae bacterium]|jgi:adenosylcobinamide kinase/adenosylcobinamide-phosphate guanylyltransferase|nr:bifunctional adenosylcobinamide kinase/adenosylcobinamide-phosphate guanylyltransferase [Eubacteriaceae bacterium]
MLALILGGASSGKSMFAQILIKKLSYENNGDLFYLATMVPVDDEDRLRVQKHVDERSGWGFASIEEGYNLGNCISKVSSGGSVLFDSVTSYVQNALFSGHPSVASMGSEDIAQSILNISKACSNMAVVSDYIFSDAERHSAEVENYRKTMGQVHQMIAHEAGLVIECAYGFAIAHKNTANYPLGNIAGELQAASVNSGSELR